jgi:phage gp36-like protein
MPYATKQDLIDRFGETELKQLTDRTNVPPTTIDDTVVTRALDDATALADGYLGKKYALPLSVTPPVLTKLVADVARYYLHGKRAEKDGPVAIAYKEAVAWLRDVSNGLVQLDADGVAPSQAGGGSVKATAPGRVFTRDSLKGA